MSQKKKRRRVGEKASGPILSRASSESECHTFSLIEQQRASISYNGCVVNFCTRVSFWQKLPLRITVKDYS
jgi:hypothetical protein